MGQGAMRLCAGIDVPELRAGEGGLGKDCFRFVRPTVEVVGSIKDQPVFLSGEVVGGDKRCLLYTSDAADD